MQSTLMMATSSSHKGCVSPLFLFFPGLMHLLPTQTTHSFTGLISSLGAEQLPCKRENDEYQMICETLPGLAVDQLDAKLLTLVLLPLSTKRNATQDAHG